jgi:hypothetical protein
MPFPKEYKDAILKKLKNMTVRIKNERGKYKPNKIYQPVTYEGDTIGKNLIRILTVNSKKLSKPIKDKFNSISSWVPADSITFEYLTQGY